MFSEFLEGFETNVRINAQTSTVPRNLKDASAFARVNYSRFLIIQKLSGNMILWQTKLELTAMKDRMNFWQAPDTAFEKTKQGPTFKYFSSSIMILECFSAVVTGNVVGQYTLAAQ